MFTYFNYFDLFHHLFGPVLTLFHQSELSTVFSADIQLGLERFSSHWYTISLIATTL